MEVIARSARSHAQLIEDLLDVSRIVAGKMRLEVRPVIVAPVIETAVDIVRPAADAKGVRLRTVLDSEVGAVLGDAERLQQVVSNLLSNAVKFTPKGGRVQVALERGLSARAQRAAVHGMIRISLELDGPAVASLSDNAASGGTLSASRRVISRNARNGIVGRDQIRNQLLHLFLRAADERRDGARGSENLQEVAALHSLAVPLLVDRRGRLRFPRFSRRHQKWQVLQSYRARNGGLDCPMWQLMHHPMFRELAW